MNQRPAHDDPEYQLSQYLDGQLSPRQSRRLERRLDRDPALREELRKYASLAEELSAMGRQDLEALDYPSLRAEVIAKLERRALLGAGRRRVVVLRPAFWGPLAAAAALAVVAVSAWLTLRPAPRRPAASEVVVELRPGPVPGAGQVQVVLRRLPEPPGLLGPPWPPEPADELPAGTVMALMGAPEPPGASAGAFLFPTEMQ